MSDEVHPAIRGSARWMTADPATALRQGRTVTLSIQPQGKPVTLYAVSQVAREGVVVAYRIGQQTEGRDHFYTVTLGSQTEEGVLLFCSCRDAQFRAREGGGSGHGCKHCNGLRAGLSAIGLI